jgi:hypothetical protein
MCGGLLYRAHWPVHELRRAGRVSRSELRREWRLGRPRGYVVVRSAIRYGLPLRGCARLGASQLRWKWWQGWPRVNGRPLLGWNSWLWAPLWRQSRRFGRLRCILRRLHGLSICIGRRRHGRRRYGLSGARGLVDGHDGRVFGEDALQHRYEIGNRGFLLTSARVEMSTDSLTSQYLAHCLRYGWNMRPSPPTCCPGLTSISADGTT